jgi:hypothetical protein
MAGGMDSGAIERREGLTELEQGESEQEVLEIKILYFKT